MSMALSCYQVNWNCFRSQSRCSLLSSNTSHSVCRCDGPDTSYALFSATHPAGIDKDVSGYWTVLFAVVASSALVALTVVIVISVICLRRRRKVLQ
jgi:hypothetical protein